MTYNTTRYDLVGANEIELDFDDEDAVLEFNQVRIDPPETLTDCNVTLSFDGTTYPLDGPFGHEYQTRSEFWYSTLATEVQAAVQSEGFRLFTGLSTPQNATASDALTALMPMLGVPATANGCRVRADYMRGSEDVIFDSISEMRTEMRRPMKIKIKLTQGSTFATGNLFYLTRTMPA